MRGKNRNLWLLVLLLAVGIVVGGLLGDLLSSSFGILSYNKPVGFEPFTINFIVIKLTLGLMIHFNLASIIGMILAIFVFSRL